VYHKAKASGVIEWLLGGETLDERQRRIQHFLENEGYLLPESPRGVDRSEEGDTHIVRGRPMTVEYAVVDQGGRKVYHYRENEIDHIMLRRIEKYDCVLSSNATNRRGGTLTPFTPGIERRTRNGRDS